VSFYIYEQRRRKMMDRRENMLATLAHKPHDHVGNFFTDVAGTGGGRETFENGPTGGGFDGFNLEWATTASAMGAGTPAPGSALLKHIEDWKKEVKFPNLDDFDWEDQAKAQLAKFNPATQLQEYGMWNGQYLRMAHLMGFEECLISLVEEPEASLEFLQAITDYKIRVVEYAVKYFKPDSICLYDDVATMRGPFMSPGTYQSLIKPVHRRFFDAVRDMGVIPNMHVCGKCEILVPDFQEEGVQAWEICQPENDLVGLQKTLGSKMAFIGGFDSQGPLAQKEASEEELRSAVRECIDQYGPGGNYVFQGFIMSTDVNYVMKCAGILSDEAVKYGTNYYIRKRL
jgi:hypothetical protein